MRSKEIDEKRAKDLCFFCDEKYFPGHKCKGPIYGPEIVEEEDGGEEINEVLDDNVGE